MKDYENIENKIFDIIERLKQVELEEGEELTKYLYTHGFCCNLASLIKSQFLDDDSVKMMHMFLPEKYIAHMVVAVTDCKTEREYSESPDSCFYDINGKIYLHEAPQYLFSFYSKTPNATNPEISLEFLDFEPYYKEISKTNKVFEMLKEESETSTPSAEELIQ